MEDINENLEKKKNNLAPTVRLNNGGRMPVLGLGTWRSFSKEAEIAVKHAIDCGYRHIDTAYVYNNEKDIGKAINDKIAEGVVARKDLFIVTKLAGQHNDPKLVERACRKSLSYLQLEYIDLYLIHFPVGEDDTDYIDTWKAMESLVDIGLTKSIGLSNFNSKQIDRILTNCRIRPVTNQVECNPGFTQDKLIAFANSRDIVITAYCPLGRPKPNQSTPDFLYNSEIDEIAYKHAKTPAQVVLRYLIQHNVVPIPKSVNPERIAENIDIFDFELTDDDMNVMDSFDTNQRLISFSGLKEHPHFPFSIEY